MREGGKIGIQVWYACCLFTFSSTIFKPDGKSNKSGETFILSWWVNGLKGLKGKGVKKILESSKWYSCLVV